MTEQVATLPKAGNKKSPDRQESQRKPYKIPLRKIVAPTQSKNHRYPLSDAIRKLGWQVFEKSEDGKRPPLWELAFSDSLAERTEYVSLVEKHDPELVALAVGIMTQGLKQPIVVRENGSGNYTVIIGNRRCLALLWLWARGDIKGDNPTIDGFLEKANTADCLKIGLGENCLRKDPSHYEIAVAFKEGLNLGATVDEMAAAKGCSAKTVRDHVKILETLEQKDLNRFRDGSLKYTKALELATGKPEGETPPRGKKVSVKGIQKVVTERLEKEQDPKVKEIFTWVLGVINGTAQTVAA